MNKRKHEMITDLPAMQNRPPAPWLRQSHYRDSTLPPQQHATGPPGLDIARERRVMAFGVISPANRVLRNVELLENVFRFVNATSLCDCYLVNKQWHAIIKPDLRQSPIALFLKPQHDRPARNTRILPLHDLNTIAVKVAGRDYGLRYSLLEISFSAEAAFGVSRKHPFNFHGGYDPYRQHEDELERININRAKMLKHAGGEIANFHAPGMTRTESNFHFDAGDLYLTQPPVVACRGYLFDVDNMPSKLESRLGRGSRLLGQLQFLAFNKPELATVYCETGLTLGMLAEAAQALLPTIELGTEHMKRMRVVFLSTIMAPEAGAPPQESPSPYASDAMEFYRARVAVYFHHTVRTQLETYYRRPDWLEALRR